MGLTRILDVALAAGRAGTLDWLGFVDAGIKGVRSCRGSSERDDADGGCEGQR
jgi:hypothetical protein